MRGIKSAITYAMAYLMIKLKEVKKKMERVSRLHEQGGWNRLRVL